MFIYYIPFLGVHINVFFFIYPFSDTWLNKVCRDKSKSIIFSYYSIVCTIHIFCINPSLFIPCSLYTNITKFGWLNLFYHFLTNFSLGATSSVIFKQNTTFNYWNIFMQMSQNWIYQIYCLKINCEKLKPTRNRTISNKIGIHFIWSEIELITFFRLKLFK